MLVDSLSTEWAGATGGGSSRSSTATATASGCCLKGSYKAGTVEDVAAACDAVATSLEADAAVVIHTRAQQVQQPTNGFRSQLCCRRA